MTTGSALYIPPYKADDQDVVVELNNRFGPEAFTAQATRTGMPVLWVTRSKLVEVLTFLRNLPKPYVMLYDLHGVDERLRTKRQGLPGADFSVFYHLLSIERNSDVMIKVALSEGDLSLPTVTGIWPNANWYEREVWDMFGIDFAGHPHLSRIMMPPTWEGHPLRKDFPARATEFDPFSLNLAKQQLEEEAARFRPEDWGMKRSGANEDYMFLNLGPNHPSAHGAFRIILQLDGEEIVDCVPDIGYHHRGAEKMAERQSWHSFIPYTDRIDYLGGVMNNLPYVLSVEKLAGIKVPEKVDVIRIMMAEFFRITSHLLFLGTYIQDVGAMTPVFFTFTDRQRAYTVIEAITGFRLHPAGTASVASPTTCRVAGRSWSRTSSNGCPSASTNTPRLPCRTASSRAGPSALPPTTPRKPWNGASPVPACAPPVAISTCARPVLTPATRTSSSKSRWPPTVTPMTAAWFASRKCARASRSSTSACATCRKARTRRITR